KLAIAAGWWERGLGDREVACAAVARTAVGSTVRSIVVGPTTVRAPREMLVFSCNGAAVALAAELERRAGQRALPALLAPLLAADALAPAGPDVAALASLPGVDWQAQAAGIGPLATSPLAVARWLQAVGNDGVAGI